MVQNQQAWRGAQRLLAVQLGLTFLIALMAWLGFGALAGWSAMLGGLVSVIPNAYFAYRLFQYHGAQAAKRIVNSFYKAEAAKLLMTMALFTLVFTTLSISALPFFLAFIAVQLVFWAAPLIVDSNT